MTNKFVSAAELMGKVLGASDYKFLALGIAVPGLTDPLSPT